MDFEKVGAMSSEERTRAFLGGKGQINRDMPTRIGPYTISGVLGQGGMGTVFLAEQTEPVQRQVALKVVKLGMERDLILARFQLERQALARMNHPFIATVFDAGTHDGNPYFVMELVDGEPITHYCNRNELTIKARLALFFKVCSAISHAHQRMVIHRDLKPSNILVTEQDGEAIPKIIDFGVARDNALTEDTGLTHAGVPLGTPSYLPPEQIEGNSSDLDARADIFALGVVLYELLSGTKPFDSNGQVHRLLIRIQEEDPPPPSRRFLECGEKCEAIAKKRGLQPVELVNLLSRDLDWIVLKAIARHREERYDSISSFQSDLQRYRLNHPVLARPPSPGYRARKFFGRHRLGVIASAAVFFALVLGVAGTTMGMIRAEKARLEAVKAEKTARVTVEYLREILSSADPSVDGHQVKVADMLDKASRMIASDFQTRPEIEAPLRKTLGWTYLELGLYSRAQDQLDRCIELQTRLLGADHLETLSSYNALGRLNYKLGKYEDAEAIHRQVLKEEIRQQGVEHPTTMWTQYNLAKALDKQGDYLEAEAMYRHNVSIRKKVLGPKHPHTLISINSLGLLLANNGKLREGETLLRSNISALKYNMGLEHPNTLNAMANLVAVLNRGGQHTDALLLADEVEVLQLRVFGPDHPESLETLAQRAYSMGRLDQCDKALGINEGLVRRRAEVLGENHPLSNATRVELANNLCCVGRHDEAVALYETVLLEEGRINLPDNVAMGRYQARFGACLLHVSRGESARYWLEQAFAGSRIKGSVAKELLEDLVRVYTLLKDENKARQYRSMLQVR